MFGAILGFEFNLGDQSADGGHMSDVDSSRWMASEHDLEFVDLETYGVDRSAAEILPASFACLHHVVAIKRKFGTPVVATADPDDLVAHESVRSTIGRDFISVVASSEQIEDYLNQLFGPEDAGENSGSPGPGQRAVGDQVEVADPTSAAAGGAGNDPLDDPLAAAVDVQDLAPADCPRPLTGKLVAPDRLQKETTTFAEGGRCRTVGRAGGADGGRPARGIR